MLDLFGGKNSTSAEAAPTSTQYGPAAGGIVKGGSQSVAGGTAVSLKNIKVAKNAVVNAPLVQTTDLGAVQAALNSNAEFAASVLQAHDQDYQSTIATLTQLTQSAQDNAAQVAKTAQDQSALIAEAATASNGQVSLPGAAVTGTTVDTSLTAGDKTNIIIGVLGVVVMVAIFWKGK